jgi:uncharacterized protein YfdQ (DUF2303 family)
METRTENDTVAELARKGVVEPRIITTQAGRQLLILPALGGSATFEDVTEERAIPPIKPLWIDQRVTVQTADSLVAYAVEHWRTGSVLFADIADNTIVAVIDYHKGGVAERLAHRATLALPHSIEWKTWAGIDGKLMGQLEFARFLEENAADIEAPSGAELLEACRDLQANRKVNFTKAVRTASDNENFEYVDETTATTKKGGVEIPSRFQLRIPVYFGGASYALFAFLRWRLDEGEGLKLGIKLHNPEHVRQAVFKEVVATVADQTDLPAYFGRI